MELFTIVLAKMKSDFVIEEYGRIDIGEPHKYKEVFYPVSLIWINEGTNQDLLKAKVFAEENGYNVFIYDINEADPIKRAKEDLEVLEAK